MYGWNANLSQALNGLSLSLLITSIELCHYVDSFDMLGMLVPLNRVLDNSNTHSSVIMCYI